MVEPLRSAMPARPALEEIWEWLRAVRDPEIPALSVVDLGVVRDVDWQEHTQTCTVILTPTYSGCPATAVIQSSIREELQRRGITHVQVKVQLAPPWTTDWLSPQAREILRLSGIAPPAGCDLELIREILPVACAGPEPAPVCPRCGSTRTSSLSQFGSTLCKALYRCDNCREPFEYFKPH